tara:strand:+ start:1082 stop:1258 length:177 start_codon:yes stop_codon:yes gene_type:complete
MLIKMDQVIATMYRLTANTWRQQIIGLAGMQPTTLIRAKCLSANPYFEAFRAGVRRFF